MGSARPRVGFPTEEAGSVLEGSSVAPTGVSRIPVSGPAVDTSEVLVSFSLPVGEDVVSVCILLVSGKAGTVVGTLASPMVASETPAGIAVLVSGPAGTDRCDSCPGLVCHAAAALSEERTFSASVASTKVGCAVSGMALKFRDNPIPAAEPVVGTSVLFSLPGVSREETVWREGQLLSGSTEATGGEVPSCHVLGETPDVVASTGAMLALNTFSGLSPIKVLISELGALWVSAA